MPVATQNSNPSTAQLPQFPSLARVSKPCADGLNSRGITDSFGHFEHLTPIRQRLLRFPNLVQNLEIARTCENSPTSSSNWKLVGACFTSSFYGWLDTKRDRLSWIVHEAEFCRYLALEGFPYRLM